MREGKSTKIISMGKKIKEQPKSIRRIYMVSSAVFSAASCVYGWTAPLGAALGLVASLTEDEKASNKEAFSIVVEKALRRTKENISANDKKDILEELCKMEVEPDSLGELIKTTATYQAKYCTEKDAKEILNVFEVYFRDEIARDSHLSNLYILSTGIMTLEKLELINDIFTKDEKKIDEIQREVIGIHKIVIEAKKFFVECLNGIAFILIAMAVFLGLGIFSEFPYDRMMIGVAPICYGISEILIFFINKNGYAITIYGWVRYKHKPCRRKISLEKVTEFIMSIFITVACFLIIFCSIDMNRKVLVLSTINLVYGNMVSIGLKSTRHKKASNTD